MKDDTQIDQPLTQGKLPAGIGTLLQPLFTWRGRDVYPLFGAEGDGGTDDDQDGDPDGDEDDDSGDGTKDKGSDTVPREDFEKLRKQLSASDKNRTEAEKRLKAIEDSKKDELTKATERAEELEKTVSSQAKELADMRLQNAFLLADTGITWHDPADALALAERQGYLTEVVDDKGAVDAGKLRTKLKELAKAKPHLVKDGKQDQQQDKDKAKQPPTGSKVGNSGSGGKSEPDLSRYSRHLNR